jgi:hypothetical protein
VSISLLSARNFDIVVVVAAAQTSFQPAKSRTERVAPHEDWNLHARRFTYDLLGLHSIHESDCDANLK